jgi:hypothetical protein
MKALAQYRESQGLRTALVDVKDIYDEFGYGQKSPEAIREFVWYAAKSWQEKPRFVLLAGDASYDARNNLGFGDWDLVPSKQIETASLETASDQWYVKKDQEQLSIAIGRFPARNQAEADLMVIVLPIVKTIFRFFLSGFRCQLITLPVNRFRRSVS